MKIDLSVIIVSYNSKKITQECLEKLTLSLTSQAITSEVIVVDNGSTDGSIEILKHFANRKATFEFKFIQNSTNVGFGKANNEGLAASNGKYILFLNSDVIIEHINFKELIEYIEKNPSIGVLTVKVVLNDGSLDMACHRGFPTLWRSFTYFSKLERLTQRNKAFAKYFGGYHLMDKDFSTIHEIDSPTGAFYLTTKEIMNKTQGFDPDYFFYGEDLDLSYRIKKLGYKIIFYPLYQVLHLKNQSGIKSGIKKVEKITKEYFFDAMKIFYRKHFSAQHTSLFNKFIYSVINLKKKLG